MRVCWLFCRMSLCLLSISALLFANQLTEGPVGRTLRPHISSDAWESLAEEPTSPLDAEMLTMFFGALRERELAAFSEKQVRPRHALPWSSTIALVAVV